MSISHGCIPERLGIMSRISRRGQVSPLILNESTYCDFSFSFLVLVDMLPHRRHALNQEGRLTDKVIFCSRICRSILYTCRYAPTPYLSARAKASPVVSLREFPSGTSLGVHVGVGQAITTLPAFCPEKPDVRFAVLAYSSALTKACI